MMLQASFTDPEDAWRWLETEYLEGAWEWEQGIPRDRPRMGRKRKPAEAAMPYIGKE